jgi:peptidoglycan/LPS O-acetylase OafA/YrhL
MAVTFFFVLGGFAMTLGYKDKVMSEDFSYKLYLTRRCIKFYPLHWLTLLAALPFAVFSFSKWTLPTLAINAALLQTWIPIYEVYFSFNAVSWYLANTMFFAIVFPFVFKWISKASAVGRTVMVVALAIMYTIVARLLPAEKYHAILYISPYMRLMDFILGIILALGYLKLQEKPMANRNNTLNSIGIVALVIFLVVESCLLSENAVLFAPVYWIPVAALILLTCLTESNGGGNFYKTNGYYALAI